MLVHYNVVFMVFGEQREDKEVQESKGSKSYLVLKTWKAKLAELFLKDLKSKWE